MKSLDEYEEEFGRKEKNDWETNSERLESFKNRIIQGNCEEILEGIPRNSIDLTITSPPYDDLRGNDEYNSSVDLEKVADELYRITKEGGVVVWVVGDQVKNGSESLSSFKQAIYFKESAGFKLFDTMIYMKPGVPVPSIHRYYQVFEYMFVFSKGKPKIFNPIKDIPNKRKGEKSFGETSRREEDGDLERQGRREVGDYRKRGNIWKLKTASQERPCKKLPHPAMFSEELVEDHIKSWSNKESSILDPMCGSGTTCKMAHELERDFIGIEISEEYTKLAKERLRGEIL